MQLHIRLNEYSKDMISGSNAVILSQTVSLKGSQRVDVHAHLARCEANYVRLGRLLLDHGWVQFKSKRIYFSNGALPIEFELKRISKHTSYLLISQDATSTYQSLTLRVNLYHDVGSAEVATVQNFRQLHVMGIKNIPMTHRLEKIEMNRFLADLLDYCMAQGSSHATEILQAEEQGSS